MNVLDAIKLGVEAYANARKGDLTEEQLSVELSFQELPDKTTISYLALEKGNEVFLTKEGEEPELLKDETYLLADESQMVIEEGKIKEIILKKEESKEVELSEDHKKAIQVALELDVATLESLVNLNVDGWHNISFNVCDGKVQWADLRSETFEALLAKEVEPINTELVAEKQKATDLEADKVKLEAEIEVLQKLNDQKNPLGAGEKVEEEAPLTRAEQIKQNLNK